MTLKIKKLDPRAKIPTRSTAGSAGMDLCALLDEPLTAEINGRTVSVKALLRGENTLRVLYDVDNAQGMEPNDLVWDTSVFQIEAPKDSDPPNSLFSVYNANVGPCYGYAVGSWAERNKASETDTLSCFVDIPLANTKLTQRTLYICSLSDYSAQQVLKFLCPMPLPH